ncbi:hypothetical protein ACOBQX_13250 [Actinokineospora sp. G85]|uniref:hypothetical protein n=1 Tax=Actinokineospora sp. G85 TaxID=3406626 RepID=UPI003C78596E
MWPFHRKRSSAPSCAPIPGDRVSLPDHGRVPVLAAGAHQNGLLAAAVGQAAGDHLHATAALVPDNRGAVRVDVLIDGHNVTAGTLPGEIGREYRPVLARIGERGQVGTCPARITGGGDAPYGVYLLLSPPRDLEVFTGERDPMVAYATSSRVQLWDERTCSVTREEEHQDTLAAHAPVAGQRSRDVLATLDFCAITSGRYQGERAIEVRIDGRRVGQLTYAMSLRYERPVRELLATGVEVTCCAVTRRTHDGVRVELKLPQVTD